MMPNGKPGDHPFTDILHYGSSEFGEPVDTIVKELSTHPLFFKVKGEVADLLWETSPFERQSEKEVLVARAHEGLLAVRTRLSEIAD